VDNEGEALKASGQDDDRIRFHMSGGAIEFTADGKDEILARVKVDENDITGELLTIGKKKLGAALETVRENADGMDEARITALAKHLSSIKKKTPHEQRPRLPKTRTTRDLATVMLAVRDTVERFCLQARRVVRLKGAGRQNTAPLERVLADTCTDTNIMSRARVEREGYADKIDTRLRIGIGGAHASAVFKTHGTVEMPLEFADVANVTHSIVAKWHVADTQDKCLVNTSGIARDLGWWFLHGACSDGAEASFALTQDGVVVPLDRDARGMPIFRTEGAPYEQASDPLRVIGDIGRRLLRAEKKYARATARVYATEAFARDDSDDSAGSLSDDVPDATDTSDTESDADEFETTDCSESEGEAFAAITDIVTRAYATEGGKARKPRTLMPVHTPESWHNLLHSGKTISEMTAKTSDARFDINGKIKIGSDLTDKDLAVLEHAHASCDVCKQAKMRAPHARTKKTAHNTDSTRGRPF
jgi:hypothetical protein